MDAFDYVNYLLALLIVLGLIGLIAYALRRVGFIPTADRPNQMRKRLGISQMIAIDGKRRLVLLRRDDQEHLVLIGPDGDTVIEQNIQAKPRSPKPADRTEEDDTDGSDDASAEEAHKEPILPRFQAQLTKKDEIT